MIDFLSKLPQLPADKANHFVYGSVLFLIFFFFLPLITALGMVM